MLVPVGSVSDAPLAQRPTWIWHPQPLEVHAPQIEVLVHRVARGQDAPGFKIRCISASDPEWQVARRQMPKDLRAVDNIEPTVGIDEPFQTLS